jgi:hypothetical protein
VVSGRRHVIFNQLGGNATRLIAEKSAPPIEVESATWSAAGGLDYLMKERQEWWGPVRRPDGHHVWISAVDLRAAEEHG